VVSSSSSSSSSSGSKKKKKKKTIKSPCLLFPPRQLWVGELINPKGGRIFDPEESYLADGNVYDFPRDNDCEVVYCNIEGEWVRSGFGIDWKSN